MIVQLDDNLRHYAEVILRDLGCQVADAPGAGAAGGMGAAMLAFLGGRLRPGSEIVTEAIGLDAALENADLVITGEGRIDGQSVGGKTPVGVARVARARGVPVIGLGGCLAPDSHLVHQYGINAVFSSLRKACSLEEALSEAAFNVRSAARNIAAVLEMGMQIKKGD
jgi:glycerate kinase